MEKLKTEIIEARPDEKDNLCLDIYYNSDTNLYQIILYDHRSKNISDWSASPIPHFIPYVDDRTYDYKKVQKICIDTIENHKNLITSLTSMKNIKLPTVDEIDDDKNKEDDNGLDDDKKTLSIKITDIYNPDKDDMTLTSSGNYKMECPDCGLQGGRTLGFIIFPKSNSAFCQSSQKWFRLLEAYALKKKLIRCMDGRDKGESDRKVLGGELWTQTLLEFKEEYGVEKFNELCEDWGIKKDMQIPGDYRLQSDFADDIARIFYTRNLLFNRAESGAIIKIKIAKKIDKSDVDKLITNERGFEVLTPEEFITLLELYVRPFLKKYYKDGTIRDIPHSINKETAGITLASANFKYKMPILERMFDIQIPIIYNNKLTFPKRGYDRRFGSYLPYNAPKIKQDVYTPMEAKIFIEKVFEEFCFKSKKDFVHAIAAFITPFCRGLFSKFSTRTPVFIYMANRERAGKDYLAGCTGILYEGVATEQPPISTDEKGYTSSNDELRKKITSCMIEGKKRFHSSNNKGLLNNSVLESATTLDSWEDRVLGRNETVTYPNEMEYSLSGNLGMTLTPDLINRSRTINLHLATEDANSRTFKNPRLHAWIYDNRESLISALYTLIKHWFEQGAKPGSVPFTSFPEWAAIVGGIMESAGWDNPCTKDETATIALNPETEEMRLMYETIYQQYPNKWLTISDIQNFVDKENLMPQYDFRTKPDQTAFGMRMTKYVDRILSDINMNMQNNKRSQRRKYRFVKTSTNPQSLSDDDIDEEKEDSVEKEVATLATFGHPSTPSLNRDKSLLYGDMERWPKVDEVTTPNTQNTPNITPNITKVSDTLIKQTTLTESDLKSQSTDYFIKKMDDAKQKDLDKRKKKAKTSRELQFWEDPQCANIVDQCTKEQTLEWIKNNPNVKYKVMRKALGLGASRFVVELVREGLVKRVGDGWEITNAVQK